MEYYKKALVNCVLFFSFLTPSFATDIPNSFDHPQIGRFPGSEIIGFNETSYSEGKIPITANSYEAPAKFESWSVTGRRTTIIYDVPQRIKTNPA